MSAPAPRITPTTTHRSRGEDTSRRESWRPDRRRGYGDVPPFGFESYIDRFGGGDVADQPPSEAVSPDAAKLTGLERVCGPMFAAAQTASPVLGLITGAVVLSRWATIPATLVAAFCCFIGSRRRGVHANRLLVLLLRGSAVAFVAVAIWTSVLSMRTQSDATLSVKRTPIARFRAPSVRLLAYPASVRALLELRSGRVIGWGDRSIVGNDGTLLARVPASIMSVTPCGRSVLVLYGQLHMARFALDGRGRTSREIVLSTLPVGFACDGGRVLVVSPAAGGSELLSLRTRDFGDARITELNVPAEAALVRFHSLLLADREGGRLWGVDPSAPAPSAAVIASIPQIDELLPINDGVLAVERDRGCLRPLSLDADPRAAGVPTGRISAPVATQDGDVAVLTDGGRTMDVYDMTARSAGVRTYHAANAVNQVLALGDGWGLFDVMRHTLTLVPSNDLRAGPTFRSAPTCI